MRYLPLAALSCLLLLSARAGAQEVTQQQLDSLLRKTAHQMNAGGLLPKGWSLDPGRVDVKLVSHKEYRKIAGDEMARQMQKNVSGLKGLKAQLLGKLVPSVGRIAVKVLSDDKMMGKYTHNKETGRGTLYLMRGTVRSQDQIRGLLAHELTHAAQHQNVKGIDKQRDQAAVKMMDRGLPKAERQRWQRKLTQILMLSEGQAMQVQVRLDPTQSSFSSQHRPGLLGKLGIKLGQAVMTSLPFGRSQIGAYSVGGQINPNLMGDLWHDEALRDQVLGQAARQMDAIGGRQLRRALKQGDNPWAEIGARLAEKTNKLAPPRPMGIEKIVQLVKRSGAGRRIKAKRLVPLGKGRQGGVRVKGMTWTRAGGRVPIGVVPLGR